MSPRSSGFFYWRTVLREQDWVLDVFIAAGVTLFQGHFSDRAREVIFKNHEFMLVFLIHYK